MTNIQTIQYTQYHFKSEDLQQVFQKYNIRPEYPFNEKEFIDDLQKIVTAVTSIAYPITVDSGIVYH